MENQEILNLVLAKLEKMEAKIDKMEAKIDTMEAKFDKRFEKIEAKIDALEITVKEIQEDTKITRSAVNSLIEWAEHVSVITNVKFPIKRVK